MRSKSALATAFQLSTAAVAFLAIPANASSISAPDCTSLPVLCTYHASFGGTGGLTAGSNSISPAAYSASGSQTISDFRQYPQNLFADASYNYSVSYGGLHTTLTADSNYNVGSGSSLGASATFVGYIQDYLATTSALPLGAKWNVLYTIHATGNTAQNPLGMGGHYETDINAGLSSSSGGITSCSNGNNSVGGIQGSFTSSCSLTVSLSPLSVVPIYLFEIAHAASADGYATLDATHTVSIDSIQILDAYGSIISDAQIFDASGFDYNNAQGSSPSPVPEPSTILLLSVGLAATLSSVRRRVLEA